MANHTRRGRGKAADAVPLFAEVAPEAKDFVDLWSQKTGAPKWVVVQSVLIQAAEEALKGTGKPGWLARIESAQEDLLSPQEALPGLGIDTAA